MHQCKEVLGKLIIFVEQNLISLACRYVTVHSKVPESEEQTLYVPPPEFALSWLREN